MKRVLALAASDLKSITRDANYWMMILGPALMVAVLRRLVPWVTLLLRQHLDFDLAPHYPFMAAFFILVPPLLFGMISGFIILDEQDEHIISFLTVTPLTKIGYFAYRLAQEEIAFQVQPHRYIPSLFVHVEHRAKRHIGPSVVH